MMFVMVSRHRPRTQKCLVPAARRDPPEVRKVDLRTGGSRLPKGHCGNRRIKNLQSMHAVSLLEESAALFANRRFGLPTS